MALIIDAQTGELIERIMLPPRHPLDSTSLPVLPMP